MNKTWLLTYLNSRKNRIFEIYEMEKAFMNAMETGDYSYLDFVNSVRELELDGKITPVKKKQKIHNGKIPLLPVEWRILNESIEATWNMGQFLTLAPVLDLSYYQRHPEEQTEIVWSRIGAVADYLRNLDPKVWVSREERSYQLFHDEKWLDSSEGRAFLIRIKKTLSDLYARNYGEPFVYWLQPGLLASDVRRILIVENRSLFHSCKRIVEEGLGVYGLTPDLLIYGRGQHIVSSLPYLEDLRVPVSSAIIWYAGDYDPSGFAIYHSLKSTYPDYPVQLAYSLYEETAKQANHPVSVKPGQPHNREQASIFFEEIKPFPLILDKAEQSWNNRVRFPQEAISYQTMKRSYI